MNSLEVYARRVMLLVDQASEYLSAEGIAQVRGLTDHSEAPEGVSTLAWLIIHEGTRVPAAIVDEIRDLSEGYSYPEDFPQGLDEWATDESAESSFDETSDR